MVQKLALTSSSCGMRLGQYLTSCLFFASTRHAVHKRKLHVKFQGIFCCGRLLFLMKTIHSHGQPATFTHGQKGETVNAISEVTKHVMYFIVAVVLGTFAES
jgi:hypothetical protein